MDLSLKGKEAIICGSTQGIGWGIAKELSLLGANCTLFARDKQKLRTCLSQLPISPDQSHRYAVADFADPDQVARAIHEHISTHPVHILINNTGGPAPGLIQAATAEQFEAAFRQHLINNQLLTQAVLPAMKMAGYGRIINVISTSVRIPLKNLGVSNTIRGAVASWAKTLSNEVAADGITVNNILPGFIKTARLESLIHQIATQSNRPAADVDLEMRTEVPAKRFGEIHEIAALAAFLASPAASYINGTSIPVDGGRTGSI